jgi:hypothetical protein
MSNSEKYKCCIRILFDNSSQANMIKESLDVDDELQPNRLKKILSVDQNILIV